jgi:hypothetical protein
MKTLAKTRTHLIIVIFSLCMFSNFAHGQEYDNCSGQGHMTFSISGQMLWPPGDPRIATTPETTFTLYGDAVDNFVVEKTVNFLRNNPNRQGVRAYMWQDCLAWRSTIGSPPNIRPTCKPCAKPDPACVCVDPATGRKYRERFGMCQGAPSSPTDPDWCP